MEYSNYFWNIPPSKIPTPYHTPRQARHFKTRYLTISTTKQGQLWKNSNTPKCVTTQPLRFAKCPKPIKLGRLARYKAEDVERFLANQEQIAEINLMGE